MYWKHFSFVVKFRRDMMTKEMFPHCAANFQCERFHKVWVGIAVYGGLPYSEKDLGTESEFFIFNYLLTYSNQ